MTFLVLSALLAAPAWTQDTLPRIEGRLVRWSAPEGKAPRPGKTMVLRSHEKQDTLRGAVKVMADKALLRVDSLSGQEVHATMVRQWAGVDSVPGGLEAVPVSPMGLGTYDYTYLPASRGRLHLFGIAFGLLPTRPLRLEMRLDLGWYVDERNYPFPMLGMGGAIGWGRDLGPKWSVEGTFQADFHGVWGWDDRNKSVVGALFNLGPMLSFRRSAWDYGELVLGIGYRPLSRDSGRWIKQDKEDDTAPLWKNGPPHWDFSGLAFRVGWSWYRPSR